MSNPHKYDPSPRRSEAWEKPVICRQQCDELTRSRDVIAAALVCCVESLNEISKRLGGDGRFKDWSHPENSLRMADAALGLIANKDALPIHFKAFDAAIAALATPFLDAPGERE